MQRVGITDYTFPSLEIEEQLLTPLGLKVEGAQCRAAGEVIDFLRGADFVITQFAPVNREVIETLDRAQIIVRYGIGVDNVDLIAARDKGIPVCNVPDFCIDEVAEHTLAFILAATRQVEANAQHVRNGFWGLAVPLAAMRCLRSMTVGVVGFGKIGREVVSRLKPFKPRILVHDPGMTPTEITGVGAEPADLASLLSASDVVTLHCPATESTKHLINATTIAQMKDGAIFVNLARGAVVCTESLVAALQSGKLSFAALDVLETEPIAADHPLRSMRNAIIHSHIASASQAAVKKLRTDAATLVALAAQGQPLRNIVNGVATVPLGAKA